jgi:trehalose 6-phosphate phosphatase
MPADPSARSAGLPDWFPGEARPVGILLDFDGTLSEIAPTPEEARPARGVRQALEALVGAGAVAAVISGRRATEVASLLRAPVRCFGLYGLAVHYRGSPEPEAARRVLLERLGPVAAAHGYRLLEGKKVVELAAQGGPTKGDVVERMVREEALRAAMYAGDDVADLAAFETMDRLAADEITTLKVGVRHPETPAELLEAADVVAEGPAGVVDLLGQLSARFQQG